MRKNRKKSSSEKNARITREDFSEFIVRHAVSILLFFLLILGSAGSSTADSKTEVSPQAGNDLSASNASGGIFLSLHTAVSTALAHNPDISALLQQSSAASNIPSQAGSLPDPVFSFNALNLPVDTFDLDQEAMTQMQFKLTQAIPFPGKLSLKETAAKKEAQAVGFQVEELRLRVAGQVEQVWWEIFYIEKALGIVERNIRLMQALVETAMARYDTGKGLQQDVLLAQVEMSNLYNTQAGLSGRLDSAKAALLRLLGRADDSSMPHDDFTVVENSAEFMKPAEPDSESIPTLDAGELMETARQHRPVLKALRQRIDAAKTRVELSKKGYFPDFTLGAAYGIRQDSPMGQDRPDFASFMISMNIPVWAGTKQSRKVAQKGFELGQRQEQYRSALQQIEKELTSALATLQSSKKQEQFYRNAVIPQAKQTLSAMMSAYQVNRVDFLNVIRARLALLRYERQYWRAVTNTRKAESKIRTAAGLMPVNVEGSGS